MNKEIAKSSDIQEALFTLKQIKNAIKYLLYGILISISMFIGTCLLLGNQKYAYQPKGVQNIIASYLKAPEANTLTVMIFADLIAYIIGRWRLPGMK